MTALITNMLTQTGMWSYFIVAGLLFVETGLVIMPFLPGDSLLFLSGAFLASQFANPIPALALFIAAVIFGDWVNFSSGRLFGQSWLKSDFFKRFVKEKHLQESHDFFAKYGPSAVTIGRFVPIIRTLIPFTAGISQMKREVFLMFNIIGGFCWVLCMTLAGYWLGSVSFVRQHFSIIMLAIIVISFLPVVWTFVKKRLASQNSQK